MSGGGGRHRAARLIIAVIASLAGALATSVLWRPGTVAGAVILPVIADLVEQALGRPVQHIVGAGDDGEPVPAPRREWRRPSLLIALVVGLAGCAIAAFLVTAPQLARGVPLAETRVAEAINPTPTPVPTVGNGGDETPAPAGECEDGLDNDGDGAVDAGDDGCAATAGASETAPEPVGECEDGLDNDGDGAVDAADGGCAATAGESEAAPAGQCEDGLDNDGDGLVDAADDGCAATGGLAETAPRR